MTILEIRIKNRQNKKIETRNSPSAPQKLEIMEAVHSVMREALKIPENDRDIGYQEYLPE